MTHTPAPWKVGERITDKGFDRSTVVAKTLIAEVYSEAFRDIENEKANAHLIAAAPELLEALELVHRLITKCAIHGFTDNHDLLALFETNKITYPIIKKAKGESC